MRYIFTLAICLFSFFIFSQDSNKTRDQLEVKFTFSQECKGLIFISCFQKEDNFLDEDKAEFSKVLECQDSIMIEGLNPDLPRAIVAFLDINRNKKLDLNFIGIPIEPYAISNGFSGKWREPKFEDAAQASSIKKIQLDFLFWRER